LIFVVLLYFIGFINLFTTKLIPESIVLLLDIFYAILAFIFIVKAFTERKNAIRAWLYIITSQLLIALAISMNEHIDFMHIAMYLSGILVAAIIGLICLLKIKAIDNDISLNYFHGYAQERKGIAAIFLLCCLALLGFPFTPTFIGIDLLFTYIHTHETILIISIALGFILIEIAVLRIYARIFLGQHKKAYHPIAYRSS
jgi:NADH-quinone oxidoreductase subunit L